MVNCLSVKVKCKIRGMKRLGNPDWVAMFNSENKQTLQHYICSGVQKSPIPKMVPNCTFLHVCCPWSEYHIIQLRNAGRYAEDPCFIKWLIFEVKVTKSMPTKIINLWRIQHVSLKKTRLRSWYNLGVDCWIHKVWTPPIRRLVLSIETSNNGIYTQQQKKKSIQ